MGEVYLVWPEFSDQEKREKVCRRAVGVNPRILGRKIKEWHEFHSRIDRIIKKSLGNVRKRMVFSESILKIERGHSLVSLAHTEKSYLYLCNTKIIFPDSLFPTFL